jgi:hypothetical protein
VPVVTALVVITKLPELVWPAGIVTVAGVCAAAVLFDDTETVSPPVGAGTLSRIVPMQLVPPNTGFGVTVTDATHACKVNAPVPVIVPAVASIVADPNTVPDEYRPDVEIVPIPPDAILHVKLGCVAIALPNWSFSVAEYCRVRLV